MIFFSQQYRKYKTALSLVTFFSIFLAPVFVLAQTVADAPVQNTESTTPVTLPVETDVVPTTTTTSPEALPESTDATGTSQDETVPVQEATPGQNTLPGDDLISTTNPQPVVDPTDTLSQSAATSTTLLSGDDDGTTIPLPPPDPTASSTTPIVPTSTTTVQTAPPPITPTSATVTDVSSPENEESVLATLSVSDLAPKREYVVSIAGPPIATEKEPEWQKTDAERETKKTGEVVEKIDTNIALSVAPIESDALFSVSGVCQKKYFVVLLYKHEEDYSSNPGSYVLNRAYPCQNGEYQYSINEIPGSFAGGTYYLLIAEQGDSGPWSPITSLTPVTLAPLLP